MRLRLGDSVGAGLVLVRVGVAVRVRDDAAVLERDNDAGLDGVAVAVAAAVPD